MHALEMIAPETNYKNYWIERDNVRENIENTWKITKFFCLMCPLCMLKMKCRFEMKGSNTNWFSIRVYVVLDYLTHLKFDFGKNRPDPNEQ